MNKPNNIKIKNWTEYKTWIESLISEKRRYFYRGQLMPNWKLQTTFHREAASLGLTLLEYLDQVIPEIHYYICAHYNEIFDLQIKEEFGSFLALLQHHGFPTPLLDWTLSPYIAAYFAFREVDDKKPQTESVKIFIFDYHNFTLSFKQPLDLRDMSKLYVSVLRTYARHNPRLVPQRGVYTVTNVADMEGHLNTLSRQVTKNFLYSLELSVYDRTKAMRDLSLMGINEMTMFPGVDGICRSLREQFFSRDVTALGPVSRTLLEKLMERKIK